MLATVGGLMATLIFPQRTGVTLALTATYSAAAAIRRSLRSRDESSENEDSNVVNTTDESVVLQWSAVTCLLATKKNKNKKGNDTTIATTAKGEDDSTRVLLDNSHGVAKPGRILSIMGPSGSGKTTLLNTLAGRVQASSSISIHGNITINGKSINSNELPVAYVTQEDLFFSQLTVRETLDLATKMRMKKDITTEEREEFINQLIRKLDLYDTSDSRVGNEKTRGISGGEKKRLSLAIELISTPKLILCDEPTSGLSSFQAERVMKTLRALAIAGHTVICSIHQPSSSIFALSDDLILLASGKQIYSGPTDKAQDHFTNLGFAPPENQFNPAERYLELISVDYTSDETINESKQRIEKLAAGCPPPSTSDESDANTKTSDKPNGDTNSSSTSENNALQVTTKRRGPLNQIGALFTRAWKQTTRDKKTNVSRFMSSFWSALIFGGIYWKLGKTQRTVQDRLGLLQVCIMNNAMSSLVKTLNIFPSEAVLVNRERVSKTYNVFEYLSSKLLAEFPIGAFFPLCFSTIVYPMTGLSGGLKRILTFYGINILESFTAASYGLAIGALVPSTEAALAVGPSSFTLQVVFGGLYITEKSVPKWASWLPKISIIKHGFEALCVNELRGLEFETENSYDVKTGDQVLERLTWSDSSVMKSCSRLGRCLAFNYLLTYTLLTLKKPKFEKLKDPISNEVTIEELPAEEQESVPNGEIAAA